jgi:hypothetical protein
MENISNNDVEKHEDGMRASRQQAISTRRMINFLMLCGDRIKPGTKFSGEEVRAMVAKTEKAGFTIPDAWTSLSVAERRTIQLEFDKKIVGVDLPFKGTTTTASSKYTDEQLDALIRRQEKDFEAMLAAEAAAHDPLLKLAKSRARVPLMKGQRSPEDQALYDANKRLSRD